MAVIETGSITSAAGKHNITVAAMNQRINHWNLLSIVVRYLQLDTVQNKLKLKSNVKKFQAPKYPLNIKSPR